MDKDKLIQICKDTVTNHRSKYVSIKERWLHLVERYDGKLRAGSISADTESRFVTGAAYALVENSIPRLLAKQPRFQYIARGKEDSETTEIYDEFVRYQQEDADVLKNLKTIARWGLITGLCGWKMVWNEEREIIKKKGEEVAGRVVQTPLDLNWSDKMKIGKTVKVEEENIKAGWKLIPIKPFDLVWNVEAEEMCDVRIFGHKQRMKLKEAETKGYDVKDLEQSIRTTLADYWKGRIESETMSAFELNQELKNQDVELYELYTKMMNDKGFYEYHVVILGSHANTEMAGDNIQVHEVAMQENPFDMKFIPMGVFRPVKRPGKFYGNGVIEPVLGLIDAQEDQLNLAFEALLLDTARPLEYVPNNIYKDDGINFKPGSAVAVRQLGASIAPMPTATPRIGDILSLDQTLERSKQNTSGITDFQTGADKIRGSKTLGEVQIKTEESNMRMRMILEELEKEVLLPMGKYALWMNQQFLGDRKELIYRIVNQKGKVKENKIKIKDIEAIKDISIVSGSTAMVIQEAELQKWSLMLDKAMQYNAYVVHTGKGGILNTDEIVKKLIENGLLEKNVEKYIPSMKEQEEEGVKENMKDLQVIRQENENPQTARVMPNQNHENHIRLHKPRRNAAEREGDAQTVQLLDQHINDHAVQGGGRVPTFQGGDAEGQPMPPEETNQPNQM